MKYNININIHKIRMSTNINLVQSKRTRHSYAIFDQKPIEKNVIPKATRCTENVSTTQNVVESTKNANITQNTSSHDKVLEETSWIRSEEGITATLEGKNNNNTKTFEQDNSNNTETDNNNYSTENNYTTFSAEDDGNITSTEANYTIGKSFDNLKDYSGINDAYSISDSLNIDNTVGTTSYNLDIVSKILAKIDELIKNIEDGNVLFDDMIDILIYIAILYFFFKILFMLIIGILSIIKYIWVKAQINYISKLQNTINSIKLEKAIANIYYKTVIKTNTIVNTVLDISNKLELKDWYNYFNYIMSKIKNLNKNRYKLENLRSNNIASYDTNITVYMLHSVYNPIINQQFNYSNSPIWPPTHITRLKYQSTSYIWNEFILMQKKYNTTHKYYVNLLNFLYSKCDKGRSKDQIKEKIYTLDWVNTSPQDKIKFNNYIQQSDIVLTNLLNQRKEVRLLSLAREFKVNESEVTALTLQLLIHYFSYDAKQRYIWQIAQQPKEVISNKEPDFYIRGKWQEIFYTKLIFELKTYDQESFTNMIKQIEASSIYTIGNVGEYTEEFDENTREIKFTGSSQFVILIRATKIAFLERYSYDLNTVNVNGWNCVVPLTKPVDKTKGIENPRLVQIMSNYRHLCDNTKPFPYEEEVVNNYLGKYYVFDLIAHHDACHELFVYVSSELPRLHSID
jgi:hypothetical protein